MKKIMSFFLSIVFILSLPGTCLAAEYDLAGFPANDLAQITVSYNEFDLVKELSQKTSDVLRANGFSASEVADIQNYQESFSQHIDMLDTLSDEVLSAHGYTQDQIEKIRTFDGSEAEMRAIASTVTISAFPVNFEYDGEYSRGRLGYSWSWTGVPNFKMIDLVAVSWNSWAIEYQMSDISYYGVDTGEAYTTISGTFTQDGNGVEGAAHKFNVLIDDYYYAKRGVGRFDVRSDVHAEKDFFYYLEYGHSQVSMSQPSFSVGSGGMDGSISFSFGVVSAGSTSGEYRFT